jgi:hypothetical protein
MSPTWTTALIEGVTPFLMGICFTLLAYRVVGPKAGQNAQFDSWHSGMWGKLFRIFGPCLILLGLLMSLSALMGAPLPMSTFAPPDWKRYALGDGSCSAEFPARPQPGAGTQTFETPHKLKLEWEGGTVYYTLEDDELSGDVPKGEEQALLDQVRDKMLAGMKQKGMRLDLVSERQIDLDGTPGREVQFIGDFRMWARFYVKGNRIYTIVEVTPVTREGGKEPGWFLKSFVFGPGKE